MLYYERSLKNKGFDVIFGVDEAGRGPLAGPVVAAAVALKTDKFKARIDDSKKLTPRQREEAFFEIMEKSIFGFGMVNERVIDDVNILEATRMAMRSAVAMAIGKLDNTAAGKVHVIVDGNIKIDIGVPFTNIIKGDALSMSIAGASILAKVVRDRLMYVYDRLFPEYGFLRHKGYPTEYHRRVLKKLGPTIIHRKTFCGVG